MQQLPCHARAMEAARLDGSASAGSPARQREAAMELQRAGRFAEALPLLFKARLSGRRAILYPAHSRAGQAAVAGDGEAQYLMGCYCWSVGGAEDAAGLAWWTQATVGEPPHARAAFRLGLLYSDGRHMDPDLPQAYRMFSLAARQGLPEAALHVAACLRDGRGVTRQLARAVELVMKLAEGGHAPAMHELATMYLHGVPKAKLPQSLALAHQWLLKAADAGFAQALYELGVSFTVSELSFLLLFFLLLLAHSRSLSSWAWDALVIWWLLLDTWIWPCVRPCPMQSALSIG